MLRELGVRLGEEAFAARVLQRFGSKRNLLVLNDEAHHAYRPAPFEDEKATAEMDAEEKRRLKQEKEAATVWISGLDRINAARGINFCMDLSATPFYIRGSGYTEGLPLRTHGVRAPWLASDFGLVDAIESGIVKIPRMPVEANSGRPVPEYFALWQWINENLPAGERATARRKPNPEAVLRQADGALKQLAGEWKASLEAYQKSGVPVPACMIAVCDNTDIAEVLFDYLATGKGNVFPDLLKNEDEQERTIRIDSNGWRRWSPERRAAGRSSGQPRTCAERSTR